MMSKVFEPSLLSQRTSLRIRAGLVALGLMVAWLVALIPTPTYAAAATTTLATCSEVALRQAVANAANGDTIKFGCSGTITLTGGSTGYIEINKNLTLDGSGQQLTISGGNNTALFYVYGYRTVNFYHLTLANAYTNTDGAAIFAQQYSTVNISYLTFSGNSAALYGAALFNQGATVTINHSSFSANSVPNDGGALYNGFNGQLKLSNTSFGSNRAKHGGAIYNDAGSLTVDYSTFTNNSASAQAGAVLNWLGGTATIKHSTFGGNQADSIGAVYNLNVMSITNSTFSANKATGGNGGALGNKTYSSGLGQLTVVNSTLASNSAQTSGGGISNEGSLSVINSTLWANTALWAGNPAGGGIRNFSWGTAKLTNTIMANTGTGGNCVMWRARMNQAVAAQGSQRLTVTRPSTS